MRFLLVVFLVIQTLVSLSPWAAAIEWVSVADIGNAPDDTGFGSVFYPYRISKFETTFSEYAEFLNAVAADDPYGLYVRDTIGLISFGGIARIGEPGDYSYFTFPGQENKPVHGVSFFNALRFANWMHNGKPTGPQGSSTTEDGAYTIVITEDDVADNSVIRNEEARVFIPSEDEWYKAAYYKGGGLLAGYWDYPTRSDAPPAKEPPPGGTNSANYSFTVSTGHQTKTNEVGAYVNSPGPYGTFDQAGNLWEWNEGTFPENDQYRGLRGSAWTAIDVERMSSSFRGSNVATNGYNSFGFRLASLVPLQCDFDDTFACDVLDLDLLMQAFGTSTERFNLDPSNDVIDEGDRDAWLSNVGTSLFGESFRLGDTNLDGLVNATDLNDLGQNWLKEYVSGWSAGDFNGDRHVETHDLNSLGVNWQSDILPVAVTVPEPQLSWPVLAAFAISIGRLVSRRSWH